MDGLTKYMSAEEEAALTKTRKEDRAKAIDEYIKSLPDQRFRADYLATEGAKPVSVSYLGVELARTRKRLTRRILEEVVEASDRLQEFVVFQRDRIRKLEADMAELKATPPPTLADSYAGIWQPGGYGRGAVVTNRGSLWLCTRATTLKPGAGAADDTGWILIVKAGKDGKDADTRALEAA